SVSFPASLPEALAILAERPEAVPVAGGTDLLVHWPARVAEHERDYVDLSGIAELKAIAFRNGELLLGALATYWDVIHAGRMREGRRPAGAGDREDRARDRPLGGGVARRGSQRRADGAPLPGDRAVARGRRSGARPRRPAPGDRARHRSHRRPPVHRRVPQARP